MRDRTYCRAEREGHLLTVTINRPEAMNALHSPANFELDEVFDDFFADPDLWVCIVTGAGDRAFSAGNDLKYSGPSQGLPPGGYAGLTARYRPEKPLIAAVNGVAVGGGFEAVLACDLAVAAETASFALLEPRIGFAALAGGLQRLARQIPYKQAMDIVLTGRRISAAEALAFGLVNEIVPLPQLMERARSLAMTIMESSPLSIRASKEAIYRGLAEPDLAAAVRAQDESPLVRALIVSEDRQEGKRAFVERRAPRWTGR